MISQKQSARLVSNILNSMSSEEKRKKPRTTSLPMNLVSMKPYSGANVMLLACSGLSPYRLTRKQVGDLGGKYAKGIGRFPIFFYSKLDKKNTKGEIIIKDGEKETTFVTKIYMVCNLEHTTLIEQDKYKELIKKSKIEAIQKRPEFLEPYLNSNRIEIKTSSKASYVPSEDFIKMPSLLSFDTHDDYIHTLAHETVHSTGHEKRLNRIKSTQKYSQEYAKEEIVAEVGAKMLCDMHGIQSNQSFLYLASRASHIKTNGLEKELLQGINQSGKAINMILS